MRMLIFILGQFVFTKAEWNTVSDYRADCKQEEEGSITGINENDDLVP